MYYPQTANGFGTEHVLLLLICNAAIAADIGLVKVEGMSAHCVLVDRETRIKDNYKEQKAKTKATSNKELLLMINMMATTMNKMQLTMADMMTTLTDTQETIRSLQDQVLSVKSSVDSNISEQQLLKRKMDFLRTLLEATFNFLSKDGNNMNQDSSPFQTDSPSVCLSLLQVTTSSCTK